MPLANPSFVAPFEDDGPRKGPRHRRGRGAIGLLIDDDDRGEPAAQRLERRQASREFLVAAVVDDHQVDEGRDEDLHSTDDHNSRHHRTIRYAFSAGDSCSSHDIV